VYEARKGTVHIHWGKYIRDGKVTAEGMPVITEAMEKFGSDILKENPNYFNKKENT
jgi:hypothetical protein